MRITTVSNGAFDGSPSAWVPGGPPLPVVVPEPPEPPVPPLDEPELLDEEQPAAPNAAAPAAPAAPAMNERLESSVNGSPSSSSTRRRGGVGPLHTSPLGLVFTCCSPKPYRQDHDRVRHRWPGGPERMGG